MAKRWRALLLATAILVPANYVAAAPQATTAQPASSAPSRAEALALVKAFSPSSVRRDAELSILDKDFVNGLRKAPNMPEMLDAFPTLGLELTKAMKSQVDVYIEEYDARFFPQATVIVQESLSRDDVRTLTEFYTSPTGQRAMSLVSQNIDGTEILDRAANGESIDSSTVARQTTRLGLCTYAKLSDAERQQFSKLISSPAGRNLAKILPRLTQLQLELANNPGPKFKAQTQQAMGEAFKRVTGVNPFEQ